MQDGVCTAVKVRRRFSRRAPSTLTGNARQAHFPEVRLREGLALIPVPARKPAFSYARNGSISVNHFLLDNAIRLDSNALIRGVA
jgi:hypothetical protein